MREWIDEQRKLSGRLPRRYPTIEDAFKRMQEENKHLSAEQARHLTQQGVNQNEDGTYSWKFDNYVRTWPPYDMTYDDIEHLWTRIACPTLLVYGKESWASNPEKDGRLKHFKTAKVVEFDHAGHWVHHDRLDAFVADGRGVHRMKAAIFRGGDIVVDTLARAGAGARPGPGQDAGLRHLRLGPACRQACPSHGRRDQAHPGPRADGPVARRRVRPRILLRGAGLRARHRAQGEARRARLRHAADDGSRRARRAWATPTPMSAAMPSRCCWPRRCCSKCPTACRPTMPRSPSRWRSACMRSRRARSRATRRRWSWAAGRSGSPSSPPCGSRASGRSSQPTSRPSAASSRSGWAPTSSSIRRRSHLTRSSTPGKRAAIFECVGVPGLLQQMFEKAPRDARIVVVGVCMEPDTIEPMFGIVKELSLQFVLGYTPEEFARSLRPAGRGPGRCRGTDHRQGRARRCEGRLRRARQSRAAYQDSGRTVAMIEGAGC